jgi:hypothetical protein
MSMKCLGALAAGTMVCIIGIACAPSSTPAPQIRDGFVTIGPGTTRPGTGGPTVVFATTTLECGGKRYEVSTGTNTGWCTVTVVNGKPSGVNCGDATSPTSGSQNEASANCDKGCGASGGAGSCTIKPN